MISGDLQQQDYVSPESNADRSGPLTPEALAQLLPSRPLSTFPSTGQRGIELQTYRHPPGTVERCQIRDHVLVLNMAGKVLIDDVSDGRRQRAWAEAGHFSLTPAGQPVRRSWSGSPEVLLIYLAPNLIKDVARDLDLNPASVQLTPRLGVPDPVLHRFGLLLRSEAAAPRWGSTILVDSIARALTVHLLRHYAGRQIPLRSPVLHSRRLNKVIDHMKAHFDEPMLLSELAKISGLSATHFARAFRQAVGKPPHAFLIDLRLDQARELLQTTSLSITEIAFSCGFEQSQYFATAFRRRLGCTPRAWRSARGR